MMWWINVATNLIVPIMMILLGAYFMKAKLPEINPLFGYRTARSMKTIETWQFSNRLMGKYWYYLGWVLLGIVIISALWLQGFDDNTIGSYSLIVLFVELVVMIIPIGFIEKELKKNFDEDGHQYKGK